MSLNGKTALITGSSRGIGRGIALKLAQAGARIAINYVANKTAAQDTLAQVRAVGADGFLIQADVSQPDDIRHLFNTVQAEFGQLDIFVSNARPEAASFFYPPLSSVYTCSSSVAARPCEATRSASPAVSNSGTRPAAVCPPVASKEEVL
ncbi:MAG: SDR family NAD(P)-dependent oxidoreductase [Roseiflexaceae bacterium]